MIAGIKFLKAAWFFPAAFLLSGSLLSKDLPHRSRIPKPAPVDGPPSPLLKIDVRSSAVSVTLDSVIPLRIPLLERLPVSPARLLSLMIFAPVLAAAASRQSSTVPVCRGVTLSASYLAAIGPRQIPGFEFSLINSTDRMIRLQRPVPTSSHWYALTGGRWLWRASNGAGGSLADATNERSRLVVYRNSQSGGSAGSFVVQPHETRRWLETEIENPVLAYKPGCPLCSYPGERDYRVIFAYAYLPPQSEDAGGLLSCGIRSGPVPMPPRKQADDHPTGSWSSSEGEEPLGGDQLDPSQPAPRSGVPRE